MLTAYIGLGANLDRPKQQVVDAISALSNHPKIRVISQSHLYGSKAIGPGVQGDYCNACIKVESELSAAELLQTLHGIEADFGRERIIRWGARTLDLDLLIVEGVESNLPELMLPHPRISERNFVVYPLLDIAPQLVLAHQKPIQCVAEDLGQDNLWRLADDYSNPV